MRKALVGYMALAWLLASQSAGANEPSYFLKSFVVPIVGGNSNQGLTDALPGANFASVRMISVYCVFELLEGAKPLTASARAEITDVNGSPLPGFPGYVTIPMTLGAQLSFSGLVNPFWQVPAGGYVTVHAETDNGFAGRCEFLFTGTRDAP